MSGEEARASREVRRNASLERRLTLMETGRRLALLISTDLLIIALFFGGMVYMCGKKAHDAVRAGDMGGPPSSYTVGEAADVQIWYGSGLVNWLEDITGARIFRGGVRFGEWHGKRPFESLESMQLYYYVPAEPYDRQRYRAVIFEMRDIVAAFNAAFAVLMALQAAGLVAGMFRIRRSIRRTLRPIYELTQTARTMNMKAGPLLALPGSKELHLSGAIDALNNITENDLGSRIVIADEREELKGLAEAINAMLDRLDAAYSSQLRFVSDASHELRTPIAVIQGYANLLDRWGKNDQVTLQESIDAIKTEASGMQDLVEQLLFLARSDNRSIVLSVETVDLRGLAEEVLRETQMIDPSHEFAARLDESLFTRGDVQLLKQALRIFADNARKYTPSGGKIIISVSGDGDYAKVSVTDNGIGIPAQDLPHVFDRFFRADESRARETGGTGLGLAIAKWIVDRHGGFVEIISRVDIGTRITVALPKYGAPDHAERFSQEQTV